MCVCALFSHSWGWKSVEPWLHLVSVIIHHLKTLRISKSFSIPCSSRLSQLITSSPEHLFMFGEGHLPLKLLHIKVCMRLRNYIPFKDWGYFNSGKLQADNQWDPWGSKNMFLCFRIVRAIWCLTLKSYMRRKWSLNWCLFASFIHFLTLLQIRLEMNYQARRCVYLLTLPLNSTLSDYMKGFDAPIYRFLMFRLMVVSGVSSDKKSRNKLGLSSSRFVHKQCHSAVLFMAIITRKHQLMDLKVHFKKLKNDFC